MLLKYCNKFRTFSSNCLINNTLKYLETFNGFEKYLLLKQFSRSENKTKKYKFNYKNKIKRFNPLKNNYFNSIYIFVSYHNIKVFVYSPIGKCLFWINGGSLGYKGKRKATPYVGKAIADKVIKKFKELKLKYANIYLKGFGPSRRPTVERFKKRGLRIKRLYDITLIPHNGTRKKKQKR